MLRATATVRYVLALRGDDDRLHSKVRVKDYDVTMSYLLEPDLLTILHNKRACVSACAYILREGAGHQTSIILLLINKTQMKVVRSWLVYEIALALLFCLWLPSVVLVAGDDEGVSERAAEVRLPYGNAPEAGRDEIGDVAAAEDEQGVGCTQY